jgi:glycosyltransferase involved in cell wall biosynthesis
MPALDPALDLLRPRVSILVPARDEATNLPALLEDLHAFILRQGVSYEVVIIDDGSRDNSWAIITAAARTYPWLTVARHRAGRGITDVLATGVEAAQGDILVLFAADHQFDVHDIPALAMPVLADQADMVAGYKVGAYEKAAVSRVYNGLCRALFNVPVRDLNAIKSFRREVFDHLPIRPGWHRYLVVVAHEAGYRVAETPVRLLPRRSGRSKFGPGRIPGGVLDLLAVWAELRFGRRPLQLFGGAGASLFGLGLLTGLATVVARVAFGVGYRPALFLVALLCTVGSVCVVAGLLGEQIAAVREDLRRLRRLTASASRPELMRG